MTRTEPSRSRTNRKSHMLSPQRTWEADRARERGRGVGRAVGGEGPIRGVLHNFNGSWQSAKTSIAVVRPSRTLRSRGRLKSEDTWPAHRFTVHEETAQRCSSLAAGQ